MGGHPEGGAVLERSKGPGATRLRKPPPRVARTLRPRPRRQSLPHSGPRLQPQSRASAPAPSRTPPRDGHGAGKRTETCAEPARACADPPSSLFPRAPGYVTKSDVPIEQSQSLPSRALWQKEGGAWGGGRKEPASRTGSLSSSNQSSLGRGGAGPEKARVGPRERN